MRSNRDQRSPPATIFAEHTLCAATVKVRSPVIFYVLGLSTCTSPPRASARSALGWSRFGWSRFGWSRFGWSRLLPTVDWRRAPQPDAPVHSDRQTQTARHGAEPRASEPTAPPCAGTRLASSHLASPRLVSSRLVSSPTTAREPDGMPRASCEPKTKNQTGDPPNASGAAGVLGEKPALGGPEVPDRAQITHREAMLRQRVGGGPRAGFSPSTPAAQRSVNVPPRCRRRAEPAMPKASRITRRCQRRAVIREQQQP